MKGPKEWEQAECSITAFSCLVEGRFELTEATSRVFHTRMPEASDRSYLGQYKPVWFLTILYASFKTSSIRGNMHTEQPVPCDCSVRRQCFITTTCFMTGLYILFCPSTFLADFEFVWTIHFLVTSSKPLHTHSSSMWCSQISWLWLSFFISHYFNCCIWIHNKKPRDSVTMGSFQRFKAVQHHINFFF